MDTKKSFVLDSKSLKIKEVLNQDFMEIEILAVSEGLNRNNSYFTLESMKKAIPTFYNKFIMGYYRVNNFKSGEGVFEEHNSDMRYDRELDEFYWSYTATNAEKPLGLIRESDKVEIIEKDGKHWIALTAVILTKYNREAVKHLLKSKGKRKVSVEITVLKSHEKDGIEIIEEFVLDAITILGNKKNSVVLCEEGIEGASMKIVKFEEALKKQKEAVCFAYKELDKSLSTNEEIEEVKMREEKNNLEEDNSLIKNKKGMEGLTLIKEQENNVLEEFSQEECLECETQGTFVENVNVEEAIVNEDTNGDEIVKDFSEDENSEEKKDCKKCSEDLEDDEEKEDSECDEDDDDSEEHEEVCEDKKCSDDCDNNNEEIECQNYQELYESLLQEYTQLQENYSSLQAEKSELDSKLKEIEFAQANAEMLTYGYKLISDETSLDENDIEALKISFTEACENEKYTEKIQVETFMNTNIPKIFYERHKEERNSLNKQVENKQEDFSMQFNNVTVNNVNVETSALDKMRNLLKIK